MNGYKFQTQSYGEDKATMNSGVCVKGSLYAAGENDFYGMLVDIVEVEYPALPIKRCMLFKCDWFNPTLGVGMTVHQNYNMVDINYRRMYNKYEPFILAEQAAQVHYLTYPSKRRDRVNWWGVCKIKTRSELDMPDTLVSAFQDDIIDHPLIVETSDEATVLVDRSDDVEEVDIFDDQLPEEDDEFEISTSSSEDDDLNETCDDDDE